MTDDEITTGMRVKVNARNVRYTHMEGTVESVSMEHRSYRTNTVIFRTWRVRFDDGTSDGLTASVLDILSNPLMDWIKS